VDDRIMGRSRGATLKAAGLPLVLVGIAVGLGLLLPRPVSTAAAAVSLDADPVDARTIYLSDCAVCHGQDGRGTARGISLFFQGRAAVDYALSTGRMPLAAEGRTEVKGRAVTPLPETGIGDPAEVPTRHSPAYPPEVISALVDYVGRLTNETGPDIPVIEPGDVVEGGVQFRLQCAACHSWSGQGGALVERAVPALGASTPTQVAEAVRSGPGQMPAFGQAALDDHQLSGLVAYVQELRHPRDRGGNPLGHLGPVTEGAVGLVGLVGLLGMCRWIGEREPEGGEDEPEGATSAGLPHPDGGHAVDKEEVEASAGEAEPAPPPLPPSPAGYVPPDDPSTSGGPDR
jgi:ubiquinol-cytochrome c reductase cytochrome c subunit